MMQRIQEETASGAPQQTRNAPQAPKQRIAYRITKRVLDFVLAAILLTILMPVLLVMALIISLDSPGAPIFSQKRMGFNWRTGECRPFSFLKLRSMYRDADSAVHQRYIKTWINGDHHDEGSNGHDKASDLAHDARVTRVGRFIRRTSIDELPQLWNVIKGEMSLVGPRPVPVYEVAEYEPWHKERLMATPGITGTWQITSRGRGTVDEMARLDIDYVRNQSFLLDLQILLHTIPAVISRQGAG